MQNLALQEARKHVLFHHSSADGWITIAKKEKSGRFRQYHYKPEELADHLSEWMGEEVFFSQNTFFTPQRSADNIRELRSLYVDLDVYNKGVTAEWVLGKLELEAFGQNIPDPNMVIFSGRGLVLIWHIVPVPYKAIPLWRAVEHFLIDQLKDLGADSKASDPARIFRIAGTINSKNGATVKVEYRHEYRYDIHQIQYDYLPELSPKKEKKPGRKSKIVNLYNLYTLHCNRANDIKRLVDLRGGNVGKCRENICFLYRYYTCCIENDPQMALDAALRINERFTHPLKEKEVISATKSAEVAWRAKSSKEANEAAKAKGYPGAGYNIKNKDLIEWLAITEEEQVHMDTIIGSKEKNRRTRERRHKQGTIPREEYLKQQQQKTNSNRDVVKEFLMQNPTATVRQIAEATGLSKSTVQRLKKTI